MGNHRASSQKTPVGSRIETCDILLREEKRSRNDQSGDLKRPIWGFDFGCQYISGFNLPFLQLQILKHAGEMPFFFFFSPVFFFFSFSPTRICLKQGFEFENMAGKQKDSCFFFVCIDDPLFINKWGCYPP